MNKKSLRIEFPKNTALYISGQRALNTVTAVLQLLQLAFKTFGVMNVHLEWQKKNILMTVQTEVTLQDIWTVSDLVPHMEVAQNRIKNSF